MICKSSSNCSVIFHLRKLKNTKEFEKKDYYKTY